MEGNMPNPKLTDTQLIILSSASQRDDGLAVVPEKLKGGAGKKVVVRLLDQGLLKEARVKPGEPHWRVDENERPIGSGQRAIKVEEGAEGEEAPARKGSKRAAKAPAPGRKRKAAADAGPREGSKKAHVLSLLRRPSIHGETVSVAALNTVCGSPSHLHLARSEEARSTAALRETLLGWDQHLTLPMLSRPRLRVLRQVFKAPHQRGWLL
jgi:hypothetical protein